MGKLQRCFNICKDMNNRAVKKLFNEDIKSVILEDKRRNRWSLFYTRSIIHAVAELEGIIYGTKKGNINFTLIDIFHSLLSLAIITGYEPEDLGFSDMFILNAKAFLDNEIKLSGVVIYLFHTTIWLENSLGWGFTNSKIDWQEVRKRLRDAFSAFSALCLKSGLDFDMICNEYIKNAT